MVIFTFGEALSLDYAQHGKYAPSADYLPKIYLSGLYTGEYGCFLNLHRPRCIEIEFKLNFSSSPSKKE